MIKFLKTLFPLTGKTNAEVPTIVATGGGAHLFQERLELELNVKIQKEDEMFCLIKGT
jgi:type II pantothenate kinase